jgi:hypothetical protein
LLVQADLLMQAADVMPAAVVYVVWANIETAALVPPLGLVALQTPVLAAIFVIAAYGQTFALYTNVEHGAVQIAAAVVQAAAPAIPVQGLQHIMITLLHALYHAIAEPAEAVFVSMYFGNILHN